MRRQPVTFLPTVILALALAAAIGASAAEGPDTAASATRLKAAEEAFAQTMADRDHEAFVAFLADEAVFFGRHGEIRGKAAVAAVWKPFFESEKAPFSWTPDSATVLDSGKLGFTSGPVLAPDGTRVGTFNSVWRLGPDGSWKIVFDRGCPECDCPE
jgi:ketosteroid isomerase-like protein